MPEANRVPVLVTTEKRGVFFGYVDVFPASAPSELTLADARNCLYWSTEAHGFLGLAAKGPGPDCRVGPKVPRLQLSGVTSVAECTARAVERWEGEPWK